MLCLGHQVNTACLECVLFCCEAQVMAGICAHGRRLCLSLAFLTSRSHISSSFIGPLFPFSFCDTNCPLAKRHPMLLLSPSAIYKEQPIAFILINIYIRLRQTRSNPIRLSCKRLIYVCFFFKSCSLLFLWKTLSPKLVKSELCDSAAILFSNCWQEA